MIACRVLHNICIGEDNENVDKYDKSGAENNNVSLGIENEDNNRGN